jgi:predicted Zn-dependent protease
MEKDHPGIDLARNYLALGRSMEALVVAKKIVADAPRNLRVRLFYVEVLRTLKKFDRALRELEKLHCERPGSDEVASLLDEMRRSER